MRRGHVFQVHFDGDCITGLFGQNVEMRQMAACAVKEEAENLLEQLINGRTLGVFAHGTKKSSDMRENQCRAGIERKD